ncbi:MAG: hypothetical protein RLZZ136_1473 [Pseudomonadota bacterium]
MLHYTIGLIMKLSSLFFGTALVALVCAAPALAQVVPAATQADTDHLPQEIVVTGALRQDRQDMLSGVAVIQAAALTEALRPSIGETLAHTPGVSASSFGPTASRPVLRGLQGERVRVLTDGIGAIDVSNTSADHAAVVNPLLAERIEVLRGPQSLLYGSSAIGGVVNVIDRRIPVKQADEAIHFGGLASYGSAARERALAGASDVRITDTWVIHADGSWSKSDDLAIGGYALTPALRAQALASRLLPPDPASAVNFAANAAVNDRLPNTAARSWNAGIGSAFITTGGAVGLAYSHTDSLYGVPIRLATVPGQGQESPRLHLRQDRVDARAELSPHGSLIDTVSFRLGYAKYQHSEIDPSGAIGTTFYNKGLEARLELAQASQGGWKGASGAQVVIRDFDVVGDEAFLPKNSTHQAGLFTLQQYDAGPFKLEAGARLEHSRITASPLPSQIRFAPQIRSFDTLSGALGAAYDFTPGWKIGLNLSRTERAPAAEELFANGPHGGTEAYEIGDPALKTERAVSAEVILRGGGSGYSFEASLYHTWFANFVYEDRTGALTDGLPVYQTRQGQARYYGFEAQGKVTLATFGAWTLSADAMADAVHAAISGYGPAPRIPPLRLLAGLGLSSEKWDLHTALEQVTAQNTVTPNETRTPAYTMANLELGWKPWGLDRPLSFTLTANNLFDVSARRHASFLKDYAPLAGRDIRLTARLEL